MLATFEVPVHKGLSGLYNQPNPACEELVNKALFCAERNSKGNTWPPLWPSFAEAKVHSGIVSQRQLSEKAGQKALRLGSAACAQQMTGNSLLL